MMGAEPDGAAEAERRVARSMDAVGEDPMLLGLPRRWRPRTAATSTPRTGWRPAASSSTRPAFAGGHPISHVYFESGDHVNGLAWLDDWLPRHRPEGDVRGPPGLARRPAPPRDRRRGRRARAVPAAAAGPTAGGRLIDGPSLLWRCQLLGHVPPGTDPETPRVSDAGHAA